MPTSRRIVVARKPRPTREPAPPAKPPACGPIVRVIDGKHLERVTEEPHDHEVRGAAADRLFAELARPAVRGK